MKFNEKIVRLRKIKGITQDELASAVGVSRQAVYKWECGQSYPEVLKLLEIKKLFDISIDDLLDENYEVVLPEKKKRKRLTKEVKEQVEAEALAPAVEEKASEPEVAPVEEPAPVEPAPEIKEEEKVEEIKAPETAPVEEKAEEETAKEPDDSKKKVGFFGRIFGRK